MNENDGFIGTGVFATEEQHREISKEQGSGVSVGFGLFAALNPGMFRRMAHDAALAQGLPDYTGYYGYNTETHEFLAPQGWKLEDWVGWVAPAASSDYASCASSCETACQASCETSLTTPTKPMALPVIPVFAPKRQITFKEEE
jgi:hypothetical protein